MIYILDTANLQEIKRAYEFYPIEGVTTNPSIISKEKEDFIKILKNIREIIGNDSMLHAQVLSLKAEDMIEEAKYIAGQVGGNIYIKIPVTPDGIKAIKILNKKGYKITATAIFTAQQALIAAKAGANFVAPYVNRIDNISGNGVEVVGEIIELLELNNLNTKVLAASFKNVQQVNEVALRGCQSVTVGIDIMDKLIEHPLTELSVKQFINDWKNAYNKITVL
ncbi:fructose-6-phosphate aldolase [Clostridium botulinum]|uniref:Fructose-6-phosphate aldolase n=1 Tax=Clostridium botulinum TaxID=1491 RepID=A0A6B4JRI5_CLOBO|nr:fructose-6-phosphate aldolase [Clostridium botulinum]EES47829.1 putative transaldolase [Clostridium botulinum E1 str. 'BoNT E Beluga']MBY6762892.1 fructose-6-phosphate aldolase [Clostridium botulinum]MBY6921774.1 fructose-6-phosphate aldolase [Clostridium botulinum]MCR1132794.1 fructose-6-phosphate aldolase [Clostridium botulinum]NFH69950.1 fructose-6-phosphate aldolase [Clostridium botulinum]